MDIQEKVKLCAGCRFDFYNGKNPHGIRECWFLRGAFVVAGRLDCHTPGETFLPANVTLRGFPLEAKAVGAGEHVHSGRAG